MSEQESYGLEASYWNQDTFKSIDKRLEQLQRKDLLDLNQKNYLVPPVDTVSNPSNSILNQLETVIRTSHANEDESLTSFNRKLDEQIEELQAEFTSQDLYGEAVENEFDLLLDQVEKETTVSNTSTVSPPRNNNINSNQRSSPFPKSSPLKRNGPSINTKPSSNDIELDNNIHSRYTSTYSNNPYYNASPNLDYFTSNSSTPNKTPSKTPPKAASISNKSPRSPFTKNKQTLDEYDFYRGLNGVPEDGSSRVVITALRTLQEKIGKLEQERLASLDRIYVLEKELEKNKALPMEDYKYISTLEDKFNAMEELNALKGNIADLEVEKSKVFEELQGGEDKKYEALRKKVEDLEKELKVEKERVLSKSPVRQSISEAPIENEEPPAFIMEQEEPKEELEQPQPISCSQIDIDKLRYEIEQEKTYTLNEREQSKKPNINKKISQPQWKDYTPLPAWKEPVPPLDRGPRKASKPKNYGCIIKPKRSASAYSSDARFQELTGVDKKVAREMPFIAGGTTGKTHSLPANIQKVFSLLKSHNVGLCEVCSKKNSNTHICETNQKDIQPIQKHTYKPLPKKANDVLLAKRKALQKQQQSLSIPNPEKGIEELTNVLLVLEKEYSQLKEKYSKLVSTYERVSNGYGELKGLKNVGDNLRDCISTMDVKSEQIRILNDIIASSVNYLSSLDYKKTSSVPKKLPYARHKSPTRKPKREYVADNSPSKALASLNLLRSTLKVQNELINS